ncbi:hypothetical protein ALC60_09936 [Trachymyrmex zeteki]|uniref:Uncharacterized protein n=1 Tax=Mycetomoellerius zeteki TaxID=64791 RepID=A0A151WT79_9HYME|nr:hypothetical protein ALC60_09936 [Trachymyrmex zeteki]
MTNQIFYNINLSNFAQNLFHLPRRPFSSANDIAFASVNFVIRDITCGERGGRIAVTVISRNFEGNEITLTREKVEEDGIKMSRCFKGLCNFRLNARIPLFIDNADESKVGNRVRGKGLTPGSRECARE